MWRQEELERINTTMGGAERKAALCMLLEQESLLIASIGRHKIAADEEGKERDIRKFLDTVRYTTNGGLPSNKINISEPGNPMLIKTFFRNPSNIHVHVRWCQFYVCMFGFRLQLPRNGLHLTAIQQKWTHPSPYGPYS